MENEKRTERNKLAATLCETALKILQEGINSPIKKGVRDPKVFAMTLLSRSLLHFKATLLLLDNGLIVEARILVRSCFENLFWIAALREDGDKFVQEIIEDEMKSRHSRSQLALQNITELSDEGHERLRDILRFIGENFPNARILNPKNVVKSGVIRKSYLIYKQLSADAAHPTVSSLSRHLTQGENNSWTLNIVPQSNELDTKTTDWAFNSMIGCCVGVNEILGGTQAGQGLNEIDQQYRKLLELA